MTGWLIKQAIRYADGVVSKWRIDLLIIALLVFAIDVCLAHTVWAVLAEYPRRGEWTISQTLERLAHISNLADPDYMWYVATAEKINRLSPGHIKSILK